MRFAREWRALAPLVDRWELFNRYDLFGWVAERGLPALECLDQECVPQIVEIAVGLDAERLLKGEALRQPGIDLVGIHMLAKRDVDSADPWQLLHCHAHVVRHQKRKVGGAPIGRQPKLDVDAVLGVHIGPGDEFEVSDRLVEFRVGYCLQPGPDFGLAIGDCLGRHAGYSAARAAVRWA